MKAPDKSGKWEPIYSPARAEPIGWAHRRSGRVVHDKAFDIKGARIVRLDDETMDALIVDRVANEKRVGFLERMTGLKFTIP